VVAGSGPAKLNNGFHGRFLTDFATFFTVPDVTHSHGDPLDFVTGYVHCDPLERRAPAPGPVRAPRRLLAVAVGWWLASLGARLPVLPHDTAILAAGAGGAAGAAPTPR